jgi:hypothetical protein
LKKEEKKRESYAPTDEVGGVKMKKNEKKKSVLKFEKMVFFVLLFFGCCFGFAFHR